MAFFISLLTVFQLSVLAFSEASGDKLLVRTTAGDVRGVERELNGTWYRVFAGIPYAEPPVGQLRFAAPIAKTPWDGSGVLNATSYGPSCPQDSDTISAFLPDYLVQIPNQALGKSEDCLTLNVYTPYPPGNGTTDSSWAVMVWLHGGNYRNGKGSAYDAAALALTGGIIVVTMNYRLGPFGFLYTGEENAPGNLGLKDQQLALRWVKDNIEDFGGDPSRVTLFGQAGVHGSATLHMFAKDSRQLFHRVGAHSGVFRSEDLQESADAISVTKLFAKLANCPHDYSSTLVDCLRGKEVEEILAYNLHLSKQKKSSYVWRPVFTRDFFVMQPGGSMMYDLLAVFNSGEGSIALDRIKDMFPDPELNLTKGVTEEQWENWLDNYIDSTDVIDKAIEYQYIDNDITDENIARVLALVNVQSARDYIRYGSAPLRDMQSMLTPTHVMIFDHRSSADDRFPGLSLVSHGSELPYIFGVPFDESRGLGARFTDEERELSYRMIRYWSNFAKTGDPNKNEDEGNSSSTDQTWPEYGGYEEYLKVQLRNAEVGVEYLSDEIYFWDEYLPKLRDAAEGVCPALPETEAPVEYECEEPVVGERLGIALNLQQTETLIEALIFICIALVCVGFIVVGVACGYKYRVIAELEKKTDVEHGTVAKTGGTGEINRALLEGEDDAEGTSGSSSPERDNPTVVKDKDDYTLLFEVDNPVYARVTKQNNPREEGVAPEDNPEQEVVDNHDTFPPPPEEELDVEATDDKLTPAEFDPEEILPPPPDDLEQHSNLSDEFQDTDDIPKPPPDGMDATAPVDDASLASGPDVESAEAEGLKSDPATEPAEDESPETDHAPMDHFHSLNQAQSSQLYDRIMNSIPQ